MPYSDENECMAGEAVSRTVCHHGRRPDTVMRYFSWTSQYHTESIMALSRAIHFKRDYKLCQGAKGVGIIKMLHRSSVLHSLFSLFQSQ